MKVNEFIATLKRLATETKTVYALGMWGQPMNEGIIKSKTKQLPKWYSDSKIKMLTKLIGTGTFGFDCVCMIKSVLWGFNFDTSKSAGGAKYASNDVPDMGADSLMNYCNDVSTDFSNIIPGEAVWIKGHVGVYIGDGMVVECTPKWENAVQITYLKNIGYDTGNCRKWTKHGKLKFVDYNIKEEVKVEPVKPSKKSNEEIADEVIKGKWGNGATRRQKLTVAGYSYSAVQKIVNEKLKAKPSQNYITHIVVKGDTLWGIAKKYLGAGNKYTQIKKDNNLKSNTIYVGQKIKIYK